MKRRRIVSLQLPLLASIVLLSSRLGVGNALSDPHTFANHQALSWRGGSASDQGTDNNATVEDYVAAMKEKDSQNLRADVEEKDQDSEEPEDKPADPSEASSASSEAASSPTSPTEDDEPAIVGVKAHSHHKKSNAVGDPDGDDDDDDSEDSLSEYSEEWEEMEDFEDFVEDLVVEPQMQVEVELVEENSPRKEAEDLISKGGKASGGGVGVRLGRMNNRRSNRKNSWRSSSNINSKQAQNQRRLIEAWVPHIYFPPSSSAISYLTENARLLDASSKNRLDRRTLYAGLLLEWGLVESKLSTSSRKFLPSSTSQALQASLSMATQPKWRQSAPRTSGIRLYQDDENSKSTTLSMQETVAMALVSPASSAIYSSLNLLLKKLTFCLPNSCSFS